MIKTIWTKNEIAIADELQSLVPKLLEEFLLYHQDFNTTFSKHTSYADVNLKLDPREKDIWKVEGMRYVSPDQNIELNPYKDPNTQKNFPTAVMLTEKYVEFCGCSGYSILEPGGVINRHTDIENRDRGTVRIHIPLIIPKGNVFIEIGGTELYWTDIFAFDNEEPHSAYNNTDNRRLIYLIDIKRSFLGIPEGEPFVLKRFEPYVRGC